MNEHAIELTPKPCPICDDMGMIPAQTKYNPTDRARECACRGQVRTQRLLKRAMIPARYAEASLENYETGFPGASSTQRLAKLFAQKFVEDYPFRAKGIGLLLHGDIGTGKTHLATGIMRELIERYATPCYFCDQQEFFKQIQFTYNPESDTSEREVLTPALEAEVLVLDDLGLMKLSDWTSTMISLVLTRRYNQRLTTIVTTNYPNRGAMTVIDSVADSEQSSKKPKDANYTLGDRITDRVYSRLQETCIPFEVTGSDFRRTVGKARQ